MPFDVKMEPGTVVPAGLDTAVRRGLQAAGASVLVASNAAAPTEPVPRWGIHMTETAFVSVEPGANTDTVVIGYRAPYALKQHEDLAYHHPHGGTAKFLELALVGGQAAAMEVVAATVRASLA